MIQRKWLLSAGCVGLTVGTAIADLHYGKFDGYTLVVLGAGVFNLIGVGCAALCANA
jgi:hypothetical protein